MANYTPYQQDKYSLLSELPNTQYGNSQLPFEPQAQESLIDPSTIRASYGGMQAGGLSGALMSGGVSSLLTSGAAAGGPYAIAGGLLLSELEAAQKAKAQQEAEKIANEKTRMANMANALQSNSKTVFRV